MTTNADIEAGFLAKFEAFEASLDDTEKAILHGIVHLASNQGEVEGFAMRKSTGDPEEGGQIFNPMAFSVVSRVQARWNPPISPRAF
jgi:hypothetical protein